MPSLIDLIKNDLFKKGKINWAGFLFLLSEPAAFVGIIIALRHGLESLENPKIFQESNFHVALFMAIPYVMKIPYMRNKPLALFFLVLNFIGWTLATIVYFMAYEKAKEIKKK